MKADAKKKETKSGEALKERREKSSNKAKHGEESKEAERE